MRRAFDWVMGRLRSEPSTRSRQLLTLLSPSIAQGRGRFVQIVVAGGTVVGLVVAGAVGASALLALFLALAAIYFLTTEILGLEFTVDPDALLRSLRRQAGVHVS